tara:strand:- start:6598 stop:6828 length:231 start_codon:yes stop_codon:yes gene_type:complete
MIFDTSETGSIDFNDVAETSVDTLRLNLSGSRTFVKWDDDIPTSVASLTTKEGPYTHQQILTILTGSEWVDDLELP